MFSAGMTVQCRGQKCIVIDANPLMHGDQVAYRLRVRAIDGPLRNQEWPIISSAEPITPDEIPPLSLERVGRDARFRLLHDAFQIDAGGQFILLSTSDKAEPESTFKKVFRAAIAGQNQHHPIFHGWQAAPWRTQARYDKEAQSLLAQTGAHDKLHQEYPATVTEALAPNSLDKRIPQAWLEACYKPEPPLFTVGIAADVAPHHCPAIPGLRVWALPDPVRKYVVGADPAEGNPSSDPSALCVVDDLGAQVAELAGQIDPSTLSFHADRLALSRRQDVGLRDRK